jgi:hypothetical protein
MFGRQPSDAADILPGYQAPGTLAAGFEHVVTTCLMMAEPGRVARPRQDEAQKDPMTNWLGLIAVLELPQVGNRGYSRNCSELSKLGLAGE